MSIMLTSLALWCQLCWRVWLCGVNYAEESDSVVSIMLTSLALWCQLCWRVWLCGVNFAEEVDSVVSIMLRSLTLWCQLCWEVWLCNFDFTEEFGFICINDTKEFNCDFFISLRLRDIIGVMQFLTPQCQHCTGSFILCLNDKIKNLTTLKSKNLISFTSLWLHDIDGVMQFWTPRCQHLQEV
jgi:hypothetical protein